MTPANGMLYTSQNNCQCEPGQVLGFLAFGPNGDHPTADVFAKRRPVERGPAFAQARPAACDINAWPMQRANTSRNNMTGGAAPAALDILWQVSAAKPDTGPMAPAWNARLAPVLTPPVAADGRVFVAATETGEVKAFDMATGKPAWTVTLGSRIDSAPTILGNLCVVGSHDGWVYAFTTNKGKLVWRTRVAPSEQRIVANGRVESTWPAIGSVLAHDGTLMAHAGRSSEADGGIAVVQLDPATGRTIWAGRIGPGPQRHADLLRVAASNVVCNGVTIALGSGISTEPQPKAKGHGTTMLRGYLGQTEMRGFKSAPGARATAGEHEIIADVRPDGGSVKLVPQGSTKVITETTLDTAPIHDGLAIADQKAIVALTDGRLICLGQLSQ